MTIVGPGNRVVGSIPHNLTLGLGRVAVRPETEQVLVGGDQDGRMMIATPSTTDVPDSLDELLPDWYVPWTPEAEQAAREHLGSPDVESRDLTSRVLLFHRRPPEDSVQLPESPEDVRRLLDFHEALAALGDYPEVMRRLGLVVDLEIPAAAVPKGNHNVRILPTFPAGAAPAEHKSVTTASSWDGTRFTARSTGKELVDGLLVLDKQRYELLPLDVDSATLKLVNVASTLDGVMPGDPLHKALPALRTRGVALVRNGHAAALRERFDHTMTHDNALAEEGNTVLFAEDLVSGFRIDVWDGTSRTWRSLCRRVGRYTFGTEGQTETRVIEDEGIVDTGVTEAAAPKPGAPDDLYLHEAMACWDGYSLVSGRPGRSIGPDSTPAEHDNAPATSFKLRVDVSAARRSLPKLRFGETYRMRARVADLAGNSVELEAAPDVGLPEQPDRFAYLRFEPVPAPEVVLREPISEATTPGEALERLVVRTANRQPAQDDVSSPAVAERHITAPRSSQLLAEIHGAIDVQGRPDATAYPMLARRDAGHFPVDPDTDMPVVSEAQLDLPYIPDPLSHGATLRNLPGAPAGGLGLVRDSALAYEQIGDGLQAGSVTQLSWDANWPEPRPFRIVVRDGSGPPAWSAESRVLTILLPKGEVARVALSSFMREEDLRLMAVWQWLREHADEQTKQLFDRLDPADADAFDRLMQSITKSAHYARFGGHAMLTPARELVLVHALQQPLGRPVWRSLAAERVPGDTVAGLTGGVQIHGKSTGGLELRARWDEPVDDGSAGRPEVQSNQAVVVDISVPAPDRSFDPNQPFVTIKAGNRRVARYHRGEDRLELVGRARPQHAFGDTHHREIRYRVAAVSRFREYFGPDAADGFERESDEIVVDVPSTARPAAPRVRYALPTFAWERTAGTSVIASRRRGHGLRIYLERPWHSSGEGELLGVVIWPRALSDEDRVRLKSSISQAGADPVVVSSGRVALTRDSFRSPGVLWGHRLRLPSLADADRVDVAGHVVGYDAARDLWFCDIELDPAIASNVEAYGAFVRLALVRFQPHSLPDLELSQPVVTEFVQVAPDRSAVATYDPYDPGHVRLVVAGQGYRATLDETKRVRPDGTFVQVSIEERRQDVPNELGWRPARADHVTITADAVHCADTVLWQGRIGLPAVRALGQFRVVIKEFEPWLDDDALQTLGSAHPEPRARRLVYAETIEL